MKMDTKLSLAIADKAHQLILDYPGDVCYSTVTKIWKQSMVEILRSSGYEIFVKHVDSVDHSSSYELW